MRSRNSVMDKLAELVLLFAAKCRDGDGSTFTFKQFLGGTPPHQCAVSYNECISSRD